MKKRSKGHKGVTEGTLNLDWRGFIRLLAWEKLLTTVLRLIYRDLTSMAVQSILIQAHRYRRLRVLQIPLWVWGSLLSVLVRELLVGD